MRITRYPRILAGVAIAVAAIPNALGTVAGAEELPVESVLLQLIQKADVPAREAGVVEEVTVIEGDRVKRGDLLARIDDAQPRLLQERAATEVQIAQRKSQNDISVRYAKKSHAVAESELRRAQESVRKYPKSISATELQRLKLAAEEAKLRIEQAEHNLEVERLARDLKDNELAEARQAVDRRRIESPIDGVVAQVDIARGEWIEPGENAMRVVWIDRLKAEGFLSAEHYRTSLAGSPVSLEIAAAGGVSNRFQGTLVFVSPEIDPVNNQVRVWAEIDNKDLRLLPGMRAKMVIQVAE